MQLISVNTNDKRSSYSNQRWRGGPQEVVVRGLINKDACCDLDKWFSFGAQKAGEPAEAALHTIKTTVYLHGTEVKGDFTGYTPQPGSESDKSDYFTKEKRAHRVSHVY